jgi:hypothetical protein
MIYKKNAKLIVTTLAVIFCFFIFQVYEQESNFNPNEEITTQTTESKKPDKKQAKQNNDKAENSAFNNVEQLNEFNKRKGELVENEIKNKDFQQNLNSSNNSNLQKDENVSELQKVADNEKVKIDKLEHQQNEPKNFTPNFEMPIVEVSSKEKTNKAKYEAT